MSDPRNSLIFPASPWRRIASAIYDSLLLIGLWMGVTMIGVPLGHAFGLDSTTPILPAARFLVGAAFFGWSWTHGGATPGMLAWHLQVRRDDAGALRWPAALGRYAVMMLTWGLCMLPLIALLPASLLARIPHPFAVVIGATVLMLIVLASSLRDGRRRAPCDRLTGTEVVVSPKKNQVLNGDHIL